MNQSYSNKYQRSIGDLIGYLLFEPDNLNVYYITKENPVGEKRQNAQIIIYPKIGRRFGKTTSKKTGKKRQTGGFLNRYDFAYAGRDTVNQVGKIAPKIINQATGEINKIAQQRIDQIIRSGGAEIERVAPKIIRGAIEEVYKTPFRMLGKAQFQKIKRKLFK